MKKSIYLLILGLLCAVVLNAQKNEKQKVLNLEAFEKVVLIGHADIRLSSASEDKMTVSCDKLIDWELFESEVRNGTLYIDYKDADGNKNGNYNTEPKFTIELSYQHIEELSLEGKIWIETENELKSRTLKVKGEGIIKGHMNVQAEYLTVAMDGIVRLEVNGKSENAKVSLDGIGSIDASGLTARRAIAKMEGIGKIRLEAQDEISGSVSGIGSLKYSGNPERRKIRKEGIVVVRSQD